MDRIPQNKKGKDLQIMDKHLIKKMLIELAERITTDVIDIPDTELQFQNAYRCGAYKSKLEIVKRELETIIKYV